MQDTVLVEIPSSTDWSLIPAALKGWKWDEPKQKSAEVVMVTPSGERIPGKLVNSAWVARRDYYQSTPDLPCGGYLYAAIRNTNWGWQAWFYPAAPVALAVRDLPQDDREWWDMGAPRERYALS